MNSTECFDKTISNQEFKECELIFGLVGAIGTNMSSVSSILAEQLKNHGYKTDIIKLSKKFLENYVPEKIRIKISKGHNEYLRIKTLMKVGNLLREKTDNAVLAMAVSRYISQKRKSLGATGEKTPYLSRTAHIIESLKHPDEVDLLRKIYGDGFYLIGISEDKTKRKDNLIRRPLINHIENPKKEDVFDSLAEALIADDENEDFHYGQHTRDTFQQADFFIDNTNNNCSDSINRFVDLIFGSPFLTPTFGEYAMYMAYCASLRSADLSRQIGAVICRDDNILSMGTNDVPKAGGGLYWMTLDKITGSYSDVKGGRDYTKGYDSNRAEFIKISRDILQSLGVISKEKEPDDPLEIEDIKEYLPLLKKSRLGELTEYGRIVHAEMEAILACARSNISCQNTEMYVTTFPCHNCAKHIVAAGINKIVYIEPYPKSKTFEFYSDSITHVEKQKSEKDTPDAQKVKLVPFFGVGPKRFRDLFAMDLSPYLTKERKNKESGKVVTWDRNSNIVRMQLFPVTYIDKESLFSDKYDTIIKDKEKEIKENEFTIRYPANCEPQ